MIDIIEQLAISVVGGFILNIIWDFYINRQKNGRPHLSRLHKAKELYDIFRDCHPIVTKLITYVVFFFCFFVFYIVPWRFIGRITI